MGPLKAKAIAAQPNIRADRTTVNALLYGPLMRWVEKNKDHEWRLRTRAQRPELPWGEDASTVAVHSQPAASTRGKLRGPRIQLTTDQLRLAQFPSNGNVLIRGQAGAGKTTVLTERALWLEGGTRLLLTYNRALKSNLTQLIADADRSDITVRTFHEWSRSVAAAYGIEVKSWMLQDGRRALLKELLRSQGANERPAALGARFLSDELDWIFGRGLRMLDDYLVAPRAGRGCSVRLAEADRRSIWALRGRYLARVRQQTKWDVNDPGGLVLTALDGNGGHIMEPLRYDHILIDEVQDFDKSWLEALVGFQRRTFSLAGDLAQRIYRRSFTWKEVGIAVPPARSRLLTSGHRTTRQIMQVAIFLTRNEDLVNEVDYHSPTIPAKDGPLVRRIRRETYQEVTRVAAQQIIELRDEHPAESIAVLLPTKKAAQAVAHALRAMSVDAKFVRGDETGCSPGIPVITTTMQSVKGLEWDHVFALGLADRLIPGRDLERTVDVDERQDIINFKQRLLFVAMTRARTSLTIGGATPFCRFFDQLPDVMLHEL